MATCSGPPIKDHKKESRKLFQIAPRYWGSYIAMVLGLGMLVNGHAGHSVFTAPFGELVFYGAILYHARKRLRFETRKRWLVLEVYAGLSVTYTVVNILRVQVWKWQPLAFGLAPLVVIGAYLFACIGRPSAEGRDGKAMSPAFGTALVPAIIIVATVWLFLNAYALPRLGIAT
jgi:hypothetical protein